MISKYYLIIVLTSVVFSAKSQDLNQLIIGNWICISEDYENKKADFSELFEPSDSLAKKNHRKNELPEFELHFKKKNKLKLNSLGDIYNTKYLVEDSSLTFGGQLWTIERITNNELTISNSDSKLLGKRILVFVRKDE